MCFFIVQEIKEKEKKRQNEKEKSNQRK